MKKKLQIGIGEAFDVSFDEVSSMLRLSRGAIVEMLDLALEFEEITPRERGIMYFRLVEWNSLENTGNEYGVTRERIRQIEGKVLAKMRYLTEVE